MIISHMQALSEAITLMGKGNSLDAEKICIQVLAEDPDNPDACFLAGMALHFQGDNNLALKRLDQAIQLKPDQGDYFANRAVVLQSLGRFEEAKIDLHKTLKIQPQDVAAKGNLARLLMGQGEETEALILFKECLSITPNDPVLLGDLGVALVAHRKVEAALSCYERSLAINPQDPEVHFNYSRALLLVGRYVSGWEENEWRWQTNHYKTLSPTLPYPRWDGSPLEGKRIILISEQGFGDALQLVRYASLVKQRGGWVIVQCRKELQRLFKTVSGINDVCIFGEPPPLAEVAFPMFSLPLIFKTQQDTIPDNIPYLFAPKTGTLLADTNQFRVGIIWSGKSWKSLDFKELEPLISIPGVDFYSLQLGPKSKQIEGYPIEDLSDSIGDFADTAFLMSQLDLIISSDTATAHLAAALGFPVWIFVHYTADWRWGYNSQHSPWYIKARLFRQTIRNDWSETIQNVRKTLEKKAFKKRMENPLINTTILQKLVQDTSIEMAPTLLKLFLEESETQVKILSQTFEKSTLYQLAGEAHTLKSSAGTFGAIGLQQIAKAIEEACNDQDFNEVVKLSKNLKTVFKETKTTLEILIKHNLNLEIDPITDKLLL